MAQESNASFLSAIKPGAELMGKYRVIEVLGSGNFAVVVRATHLEMGRDVALKLLKPEVVAAHPEVAQRFLAEVKIVSRLSHPNTVTIYDFGRTPQGILYMVLEYVDGQPLDVLLDGKRLSTVRVSGMVRQVLKSLDEAHQQGIVHRDLKPSNIMVFDRHGESDIVKVLDFGVAKLVGDDDEKRATQAGVRRSTQFIGTPIYMSPEQVLGQRVTPASDIYSLGLILYQMLTGDPPIDDTLNVAGVAQIHIDDRPIPFQYIDRLPKEWSDVILKATSRQPADRFQSVRAFARALPAEFSKDATGEFARLIAPTGDEAVRSVFSGTGAYVDPVSDSEEIPLLAPTKASAPAPPIEATPRRETRKFRPDADLKLDVAKVRKTEARQRVQPELPPPASTFSASDLPWLVGGAVALLVLWHVAGTLAPAHGASSRAVVGWVPAGLVAVWTFFSDVRNVRGTVMNRWILPGMRNSVFGLLSMVVLSAIVFPAYGAAAFGEHGDWYVDLGLPHFAIWSGALEHLFLLTASLVPW
ncbi:MAG: protein kinase [bacterium]